MIDNRPAVFQTLALAGSEVGQMSAAGDTGNLWEKLNVN
jgi:hypothetical protein